MKGKEEEEEDNRMIKEYSKEEYLKQYNRNMLEFSQLLLREIFRLEGYEKLVGDIVYIQISQQFKE